MPRQARNTPGGLVYHVLNRSVAKLKIFHTAKDYAAFERVMAEAQLLHPMRILSYCIMPNHWHLVLWPKGDEDLTAFMRWMTHTHVMRWHTAHHTVGTGPLYQGRFKAFPVEADEHFLTVCRYVEGNPRKVSRMVSPEVSPKSTPKVSPKTSRKVGMVESAEDWPWSSLWRRLHPKLDDDRPALHDWPVDRPTSRQWLRLVNRELSDAEQTALEQCLKRGCPFGSERWTAAVVDKLKLEHTLRRPGRPKKQTVR